MYGCREFSGFPAVLQPQIAKSGVYGDPDAVRVCGQQGGERFRDAIRPNMENQCPDGYVACSSATPAEATICRRETEDKTLTCPITDIQFVLNSHSESEGYTSRQFNDTVKIMFSKDTPNLPITTTKIEN